MTYILLTLYDPKGTVHMSSEDGEEAIIEMNEPCDFAEEDLNIIRSYLENIINYVGGLDG